MTSRHHSSTPINLIANTSFGFLGLRKLLHWTGPSRDEAQDSSSQIPNIIAPTMCPCLLAQRCTRNYSRAIILRQLPRNEQQSIVRSTFCKQSSIVTSQQAKVRRGSDPSFTFNTIGSQSVICFCVQYLCTKTSVWSLGRRPVGTRNLGCTYHEVCSIGFNPSINDPLPLDHHPSRVSLNARTSRSPIRISSRSH